MLRRPIVGLALGGGGARGLAHIGVLRVLEQEKIPIHIITGSSAGALIGAMYCQCLDVDRVEKTTRKFISSDDYRRLRIQHAIRRKDGENFFSQVVTSLKERLIINLAYSRMSLVKNRRLIQALKMLLQDGRIEDSPLALGIVASDLISSRDVVLTSGSMIRAVAASVSLPGFLPPVAVDELLLVDGGITQPLPVQAAADLGADVVIAVDVSFQSTLQRNFKNIFEIMNRTHHMTAECLNHLLADKAHILIRPAVGHFHWSAFDDIDAIIQQGEAAARAAMPNIRKQLSRIRFITRTLFAKKH
ncbi:MAG: patatin-like phospholipase family protein [candidate division KSB1 bacterium]|nr:patatin-like phospholipase family protein [candidate division KSB1 bacterium]